LTSLELEDKHARVAVQNIADAGLSSRVQILVGPALESLSKMKSAGAEPFDFVFIDADKVNTEAYFDYAVGLCHSGSIIVADNVVRKGQVAEASSEDANVQGMRRFVGALSKDRRVEASALQTVGLKGYDGFVLARVL